VSAAVELRERLRRYYTAYDRSLRGLSGLYYRLAGASPFIELVACKP